MGQLESIALAAFCCLGGIILLVIIPAIVPLLAQVVGFVFNLISGCLQMLIGFPAGCGCSCLLLILLLIAVGAVGLVVLNQSCSANPVNLCRWLGY